MGTKVAGGGRPIASARSQRDPDTQAFMSGRAYEVSARTGLGMRETSPKGTLIRSMTGSNGAVVKLFGLNAPAGTHRFRVVSTDGKFPTLDEIVRNDQGLGGRQVSFPSQKEKIVEVFID